MTHLGLLGKIARRNLLRNKRRTILAGLAIGIGLAALIVTDGVYLGMGDAMVGTATDTFLGDAQIHANGFRRTLEVEKTVRDRADLITRLESDGRVRAFAPRVASFAVITSPSNAASVILYGIDPDREPALSKIDEAIVRGSYLDTSGTAQVLIGEKLAETLDVGLGDRIVLTAAQAHSGELAQEMLRVAGVYRFNVREMDGGMAFVSLSRAQTLFGLGDDVHEIALRLVDRRLASDSSSPFWEEYSKGGNEALGWPVLMPDLDAALRLSDFSMLIVGVILFGVVALGIINTLFMSLYERMFEFGVLRAIGTRPGRMALMVLFEAAQLSVLSIVIGIVVGAAVTMLYRHYGINFVGIEYAGVTFREPIRPVLRLRQFIEYPIWVFAATIGAGLYPAVYAARLAPARAMRSRA